MSKPFQVMIQRTNPLGETIGVEIELDERKPGGILGQWIEKVDPAFGLLDRRFQELNKRILQVTQATMQLRPDEADKVRQILMLACGFSPPSVEGIQEHVADGGNQRAKQWVDDVSPRDEDGAKIPYIGPGLARREEVQS